jgi:hypothetical protein
VAPVDQHGELHGPRAAQVVQRVEGGPDGPPGEQHVIDEDHGLAVHAARRNLGALQRPGRSQPQVVAVQGDVERPDRGRVALELADPVGQPAGQVDATGGDAEQHEALAAVGALEDLVRDPGQRPADLIGGEYRFPGGTGASLGRLIARAATARLVHWVRAHGAHQSRPPSPSHRTVLKGCLRAPRYQAR